VAAIKIWHFPDVNQRVGSTMNKKSIRIGNAGGYWGDDPSALERQVKGGQLDYISIDFLAEITMSIMQKQRSRDASLGYARDFIPMVKGVLPELLANKTKLIANAGGVNPLACAKALSEAASELGLSPRIAIVYGDDIMESLDDLVKAGQSLDNMEDSSRFSGVANRIEAANVYFGAQPVVEALKWDPDIVITGRVTDTGITLAPMIHEFGWSLHDWDRLASGIVAGHLMECGTQATGGNFTDWHLVASFENMGFPVIEMSCDATMVLTKHPGSGGIVTVDTAREQLFYEMGNPKAYITPDVVADFSSIQLEQQGVDRVAISGVKGMEPTPFFKVSMAYSDGFKAVGDILVSGPNAKQKAQTFAKIFQQRCQLNLDALEFEYVGWNACHRSLTQQPDGNEIILRIGARAQDEATLRKFGKIIPAMILSGPPGVAVLGGVPRAQEVVSYWPALLDKKCVTPKVALLENGQVTNESTVGAAIVGGFSPDELLGQVCEKATTPVEKALSESTNPSLSPLNAICLARSGDKGDMCNIGVMARSKEAMEFLDHFLTAERVKNWFQELCHGKVTRFRLDNLQGFNFLLDEALGGGGTKTLRVDAQGKTFAQGLLRQRVDIPQGVLNSIK